MLLPTMLMVVVVLLLLLPGRVDRTSSAALSAALSCPSRRRHYDRSYIYVAVRVRVMLRVRVMVMG